MHYRDLFFAGDDDWQQREGARQPFGGGKLIVDTSAWMAIRRSEKLGNKPDAWGVAMRRGQLLRHPIVRLELLHHARNRIEVGYWDTALEDALEEVRLGKGIAEKAVKAVHELVAKGDGYGDHRVDLGDALIAASAQENKVGVLHYNFGDFDKLATVLGFRNVPLAKPGTFEKPGERIVWKRGQGPKHGAEWP